MKNNDIALIVFSIIISITMMLLSSFATKTQGILLKFAKNQSNIEVNVIVNDTIRKMLMEQGTEEIIKIEKNEEKEITNINFDNKRINEILTLCSNSILSKIDKKNNKIHKIPFGLISNNHLLHNFGPEIPYNVTIIGQIDNNTYINIKEYGINNSIIEVILNIEIEYQIMLAFAKETQKYTKEVILESKIVQGNIPNYYGNVNSLLN